jgi:hypothetical protein
MIEWKYKIARTRLEMEMSIYKKGFFLGPCVILIFLIFYSLVFIFNLNFTILAIGIVIIIVTPPLFIGKLECPQCGTGVFQGKYFFLGFPQKKCSKCGFNLDK